MSRKIILLTCIVGLLGLASNGWANTISGTVTSGGSGLGSVTITATGGTQTTTSLTATNGTFTANHQSNNPVTVTPTKTGYTFSPVNRTYNITSQSPTGCNFTGTLLTYTISGTVGTVDGVTMGGLPGSPVTSGGGAYTATVNYGWTGTATPSKTGYTFSPTNKTYSNVTANQTAQNYTPTATTFTISGTVGTLDGVTMDGLPGSPVTSGGGNYTATVNYGWTGTATPSKAGYTFSPINKTYATVTANQTAQNYTPTLLTYTISGTVGTQDGVTMGGLPGSPVTSGGGAYTATVNYGWTGTATPSLAGYTFSPTNLTYSNVTANQTAQNYTPTRLTYTISGTISTLSDVLMSGLPVETVTSNGSYSATVDYSWTGTVTPTKDGYTFSPASKTYTSVTSNQTAQNYTPTLINYTINGYAGTLDGVTMNGLPGNPVTSGGGAYSATVTCVWAGTVTPAKTGYTFNPSYRMYSNVTSNLTEDYTPIINSYTISGNVGGISDVTMSGLPGDPVFSSSGGAYSGTVAYGWSGTVTPTKALYNFTPTNTTYSNVTANQTQDYTVTTNLGDPNLVGWWPFNGDVLDYSGYGHNGTLTGASYVTSDIGTVLQFNGVDYVSIPSSTFATISNKITIALWANGDAAYQPQANSVFQGTNAGGNVVLNAHVPWSNGSIYFDAGYAGTTWDRINKAATANQYEGQWNHWVFTKDLSTEQMKIYYNGQLWSSGTAKSKSMAGVTTFKIGSGADGTYNYDGMICEFKIYDKVMSAAEVNDLYNACYEASVPSPADQATGVATSADLSWTEGYLAGTHKVYFGTDVTLVTNRDASVYKGNQGGTTYDPGTLATGVNYYWAVDEVNDFYANSPWKSNVWSFTTTGGGVTCPICGGQGLCDLHVACLNTRLDRISGVHNIVLVQVTADGYTAVPMASITSAANRFANFAENASFGRLQLKIYRSRTFHGSGSKGTIKNAAINFSNTIGGDPLLTAIVFPRGFSTGDNSGGGNIFLGGTVTAFDHEAGHMIGLCHSGAVIDGHRDDYRDSSSKMSAYPSQEYSVNQQQWLGWTGDRENVNITDCLGKVPYIDVPLRPVNNGGIVSDIPQAYVYEIPNSDGQIWIAIPKSMDNNLNAIQGGEIFIYQYNNKQGCTGLCMGSTRIGRISKPKDGQPYTINGLTIQPISWISTPAVFNGKNVDSFSQITIRISKTGSSDNNEPNDNNEPSLTSIADWQFAEASGTTLRNTINDGTTGPATWNTDRAGITVTGNDTLNFSPTTNTINGSVSYFDLVGSGKAITSGKVWTVMEVNDFNFAGSTVGERLRFGFTNGLSNTPTALFNIRRVASNSIHLMSFANDGLPTTGVQIWNSNTFSGLLEICTACDFDARTFQIFYRFNGTGDWTSIGAAATMGSGNVGNALQLAAGDSLSNGQGSWTNTGEYFHIGAIYMTATNPMIAPANIPPDVSIVTPNDGDTFSPGSNIALYAIADDTDGNVASVQFYNGTTLLGQGQAPAVQGNIVNTAAQATIHGTTARYSGGCINTWTNINDWLSWTPTVLRSGTFEVWVDYACKNTVAGSTYRVEVGDQIVQGTVTSTGSDWNTYDSAYLGTVDIAQVGQTTVNVIPETMPNGAVMNLQDVTLIPVDLDELYQYTWSNVPAGTYTVTAKAIDDQDANTVSDPIVIHVQ